MVQKASDERLFAQFAQTDNTEKNSKQADEICQESVQAITHVCTHNNVIKSDTVVGFFLHPFSFMSDKVEEIQ